VTSNAERDRRREYIRDSLKKRYPGREHSSNIWYNGDPVPPHGDPARGKKLPSWPDEKPVESNKGYELISFEVDVMGLAHEVASIVVKKQKDYGPNNIRRSPYGALNGLTVRIYDKISRIASLSKDNRDPENESLRDSFIDLAGYSLIGLMLLDETFPEEQ